MAFELSEETRQRINEEILPNYPFKKSAVLPVLWAIEEEIGFIDNEAMLFVADVVEEPPSHIYSLVTFYTMFHSEKAGKYEICVCKTASCEIMGCKQITHRFKELLNIDVGETTEDGMFTLTEVECLAACEIAPMIQVNEDCYGPLTTDMVDVLVEDLKSGGDRIKPCL